MLAALRIPQVPPIIADAAFRSFCLSSDCCFHSIVAGPSVLRGKVPYRRRNSMRIIKEISSRFVNRMKIIKKKPKKY